MTPAEIFKNLSAPFPPAKISWRVGSVTKDKSKGMALAYIDSRDVMDRFNEVCGPFGWQCDHKVAPDGKKVTCSIGVKSPDDGNWVWRSDGAGETDVEGEKGSYSDSLKRAAVSFGVGRYLYDLESPWVALDGNRIAQHEYKRLEALLAGKAAPVRYGDEDGQAKDWKDRQITLIKARNTLPALYEWIEKKCGAGGTITDPVLGSDMDKLKKKSAEMYGSVVQAFNAQLQIINRNQKEAAE